MIKGCIKYKNHGWLAPGSTAIELHKAKKFSELDKHMETLEQAKCKLEGRPYVKL